MSVLAAQNLSLGDSEPLPLQECYFQPCMSFLSAFENTLVKACLHATFENVKLFVSSLLQTEPERPAYCRNFQSGLNLEATENYTEICKREASSTFENVLLKLLVKAGLSNATRESIILNTLMELVCSELPWKFNDVLYGRLLITLVEAEISTAHIIKALLFQYLHYEDVRYLTAKNVHSLAMQHFKANFTAYKFNIIEERTKSQVPLYLQQNVKCDEDDANNRSITSLRTRQLPITCSTEEEEGRLSETDFSKARIEIMPLYCMNNIERGTSDSSWLFSAARGKDEENHVLTNDKNVVGGGKEKRKNEDDDDHNDDDDSDEEEDGGDSDDNDGSDDGEGEEEGNDDDDDNEGDDDEEEDEEEYDEEVAAQLAQQSKGVPVNDEDDDEDEESGDGEGEEGVEGGGSDEEEGEEDGVDEEGFEEENEDDGEDDEDDEDEEEEEAQPPKKKLKGA
ncbi:hypothetical protein O6H91_04G079300 [Diphasiastrum complanatum]|uniref:Uncharacterized protein n=1 Tax=Diphasiastrum complanatum TaxID=34168 RepID=A0ACC2DYK2_DIPCM|nr:hypothetical protein O6H91_04G079300 [Diphasiastrum complanatum]